MDMFYRPEVSTYATVAGTMRGAEGLVSILLTNCTSFHMYVSPIGGMQRNSDGLTPTSTHV
jgi:hypothetical protein